LLTRLSATELHKLLLSRQVSTREVLDAHLERISRLNPRLNAFVTVAEERAREDADRAQKLFDEGAPTRLTGVPVALKDNISTQGIATQCASTVLDGYVPPYDATVVERLRSAGAVILGKTNLDEFAMGSSTEHSAHGPTRNPYDLERSPGGSSGGSAASVAAELAPFALGSDTGGSVRQPAALCGVVGFKPTYGRCSRYGLVAFSSSLDQIGPFARTVEDVAWLAWGITGHDPKDSTSLPMSPIDSASIHGGTLKGARFALPKEMFGEGMQPGVVATVRAALDKLAAEGAEFEEVSLPSTRFGVTTYYIIAPAEASSNLARYDGVRFGLRADRSDPISMTEATRAAGFGKEVKTRILIGTYVLSAGYYDAFYLQASKVRAMMAQEYQQVLERFDAILSPTSPITAFKIGQLSEDPMALKLLDYCTIPANMGGFPALSLSCGTSEGLPVGLQVLGPRRADERVLQLSHCIERTLGATSRPPEA